MLEKIDNDILKKSILNATNKDNFSEVNESDIIKLENIVFTSEDSNGKKTGITFSDILKFPNLKYITLQNFIINEDSLQVFNIHSQMLEISFINCEFICNNFQNMQKIPKKIKFINCKNIPSKLPSIEELFFERSIIDFDSIDFQKLKNMKINYSTVLNMYDVETKANIEIFESEIFYKNNNSSINNR